MFSPLGRACGFLGSGSVTANLGTLLNAIRGARTRAIGNRDLRHLLRVNLETQSGVAKLQRGVDELQHGAAELQRGVGELQHGAAELQRGMGELQHGAAELQRDVTEVRKTQGALADAQGAFAEIETLKNPPWELWGCRRLLVATDAGLDRLLGQGAAGRVSDTILSSPQACTLVLRRLLRAVRWEVAKHAKEEDKAAAGEIQMQLLQEEKEETPKAAHTLPLMQRAREVIRSSDPTRQADDAARWSAAFSLAKRMASGGGGGTSSSDLSTSSTGRQGPSQAMLLLFLLAVGHLRINLQLDMVRFWPGLLGKPQLTVAEVKTNLADLAKARRQLETEVAVLELAHHLSRQQAPDPFSALRWQEAWERPSLDAKAYVCGVLDGKALAAREDLAEDLQVPLADLPGAAAPRMWVPLKVFRFGTRGILTAS